MITEESRIKNAAHVAAMLIVGASGFCMVLALPSFVGLLVSDRGLSASEAAFVATIEMIGSTASVALVAPLLGRLNWRYVALTALLLAIVADLATPFALSYAMLLVVRLIGGVAEGVIVATMVAAAGSSAVPGRVFGLLTAVNLTVVGIVLGITPWIAAHGGLALYLQIMAGLAIFAALWLPLFPARAPVASQSDQDMTPRGSSHRAVVIAVAGLAASFLLFTSVGAVWPLMAQHGADRGMSAQAVANALAWASAAGIAAGISASWLSARLSRHRGIVVGSGLLFVTLLAFALLPGASYFALAACAVSYFWMLTTPFYMSQLAVLDPAGRLVAFSMALQFGGFAAGPAIASVVIASEGYRAATLVAAAICGAGIAAALYAEWKMKHRERLASLAGSPVLNDSGA